jgi:hypothetical protein
MPNDPLRKGFTTKTETGERCTVLANVWNPSQGEASIDFQVHIEFPDAMKTYIQPHKRATAIKLAAERVILERLAKKDGESFRRDDYKTQDLLIGGRYDLIEANCDEELFGEVTAIDIDQANAIEVAAGPSVNYFSITFPWRDETHVVTFPGKSLEEVTMKIVRGVSEHIALCDQVRYLDEQASLAPEGSTIAVACRVIADEIGNANVEKLHFGTLEIEGVQFGELGGIQDPLQNLKIEEIPGPGQIHEAGTYEVVVELSCLDDFKDLDEEILDHDGNCTVDGMHRVVFRHENQNLSTDEVLEIGRRLFAVNTAYDSYGDFDVNVRPVSEHDHAADFRMTHGIFDAEPTPALTRGM